MSGLGVGAGNLFSTVDMESKRTGKVSREGGGNVRKRSRASWRGYDRL